MLDDETPRAQHLTPDCTYCEGLYQNYLNSVCRLLIVTENKLTIGVNQIALFQLLRGNFGSISNRYCILKLDLYDKTTYKTKDKNLVWNQYTLFESSGFIRSDCRSPSVKTYANKRTLLEEKYWRTVGSNQQPLDYSPNAFPPELRRLIGKVGYKLLLILYCAANTYNVTPHCIPMR